MRQSVIPQFRITDRDRALRFYVDGLGFTVDWEHRFEPGFPPFLRITRDGQTLFLSGHEDDGALGSAAWLEVPDVDACFRDFVRRGAMPLSPPLDMPWQAREMILVDPDGNRLRFATLSAAAREDAAATT